MSVNARLLLLFAATCTKCLPDVDTSDAYLAEKAGSPLLQPTLGLAYGRMQMFHTAAL